MSLLVERKWEELFLIWSQDASLAKQVEEQCTSCLASSKWYNPINKWNKPKVAHLKTLNLYLLRRCSGLCWKPGSGVVLESIPAVTRWEAWIHSAQVTNPSAHTHTHNIHSRTLNYCLGAYFLCDFLSSLQTLCYIIADKTLFCVWINQEMLNDIMNPVDRHFNKQMKKQEKSWSYLKKKTDKTHMWGGFHTIPQ